MCSTGSRLPERLPPTTSPHPLPTSNQTGAQLLPRYKQRALWALWALWALRALWALWALWALRALWALVTRLELFLSVFLSPLSKGVSNGPRTVRKRVASNVSYAQLEKGACQMCHMHCLKSECVQYVICTVRNSGYNSAGALCLYDLQ